MDVLRSHLGCQEADSLLLAPLLQAPSLFQVCNIPCLRSCSDVAMLTLLLHPWCRSAPQRWSQLHSLIPHSLCPGLHMLQGSPGPGLLRVAESLQQAAQKAESPQLAGLAVAVAEGLSLLSICQQHPGMT